MNPTLEARTRLARTLLRADTSFAERGRRAVELHCRLVRGRVQHACQRTFDRGAVIIEVPMMLCLGRLILLLAELLYLVARFFAGLRFATVMLPM